VENKGSQQSYKQTNSGKPQNRGTKDGQLLGDHIGALCIWLESDPDCFKYFWQNGFSFLNFYFPPIFRVLAEIILPTQFLLKQKHLYPQMAFKHN
jgi:hypothetical protein